MDLANLSNEELKLLVVATKQELERRKQEEEEKLYRQLEAIQKTLIPEFVDAIHPEHSRTTCSDKNLENGFYSSSSGGCPRCTRCGLLEMIQGTSLPYGVSLRLVFSE